MTETQVLTIALASLPSVIAVLVGILINNSLLGDLRNQMDPRISDLNTRISELRAHMDSRFDEARETWRAELHRVEEVIDARLKHLEER